MLEMCKIPVTCWYRYNNKMKTYVYNHFNEGHLLDKYPKPYKEEYKVQKLWKNNKWIKKYGFIYNDRKIPYIIEESKEIK